MSILAQAVLELCLSFKLIKYRPVSYGQKVLKHNKSLNPNSINMKLYTVVKKKKYESKHAKNTFLKKIKSLPFWISF